MGLHGMPEMRILSFTTEGIISSLQVFEMIFCWTALGHTGLFDQAPDATLYSNRVIAYWQRLLDTYTTIVVKVQKRPAAAAQRLRFCVTEPVVRGLDSQQRSLFFKGEIQQRRCVFWRVLTVLSLNYSSTFPYDVPHDPDAALMRKITPRVSQMYSSNQCLHFYQECGGSSLFYVIRSINICENVVGLSWVVWGL